MLPVEVIIDAITFSNLLALLALGLTLTYLTLKVPNFAHGDLVAAGVYVAFSLHKLCGIHPYLAIPVAFLVCGAISLASYLLVYRPLWRRGAGIVTLMIASIAVEIVLRSGLHIYADVLSSHLKTFTRGFSFAWLDWSVEMYGRTLTFVVIASTCTLMAVTISLYLFLSKTRFGTAMRAAIENPSLASSLGINVDLVYAVSWFLAGALAGVAGVFLPFRMPSDPEVGWEMLLRTFTASILGGLESLMGAILGGLLTGFAEVLGIYVLSKPPVSLSTAYRPAISCALFIMVLLVAPGGITSLDWRRVLRWRRK